MPGKLQILHEFYKSLQGTTNTTMAFDTKINTDVMNTADVMSVAGKRIVDFCRDYHMYFMTLLPKDLENKLVKENDHLASHLLMISNPRWSNKKLGIMKNYLGSSE